MIELLKYEHAYDGLMMIDGAYVAYAVTADAEDYVEETSARMQKLAKKLYAFPFYLHFEGYSNSAEWILQEVDIPVQYKPSGRTVLTQSGGRTFQAEVPAFTVEITDERMLKHSFKEWFRLAFDNNLWVLTQHNTVYYEDGFAAIQMREKMTIILTEHDAYGVTVISTEKALQQEQSLRLFLTEVFTEGAKK